MKLGLVQLEITWEDRASNQKLIRSFLSSTTRTVDWLIFPEMTLTGFSLRQTLPEKSDQDEDFFACLAREKNCWVTFGTVEKQQNVSLTLNRLGKRVGRYAKRHLFSMQGEDKVHLAGDSSLTFCLEDFQVTPAICYDLRFPSLFWERATITDVFVIIACWPLSRIDHWLTLLKARAIENLSYVVGVNSTGSSPSGLLGGHSLVVNPRGEVVVSSNQEKGVFVCELKKELVIETRKEWCFLHDRKGSVK